MIVIDKSYKINQALSVGLGWHLIHYKSTRPLIWHNGVTRAYKSCVALQIDQGTAVLILSNVSCR